MSLKIILPPVKEAKNQEQINKKMFSDDHEKGKGLLSKVLVFIQINEPVSVTELTNKIIEYYKTEYDRAAIFRACQRLQKVGIINQAVSGLVISMPEGERTPMHQKIVTKYRKFLSNIPEPFKHRFNDVNYFWVSNGVGTKYIKWCCDILGFKCED